MQAVTTIGLDIAKSVFQIHGVDAASNVIISRRLKRGTFCHSFRSCRRASLASKPARRRITGPVVLDQAPAAIEHGGRTPIRYRRRPALMRGAATERSPAWPKINTQPPSTRPIAAPRDLLWPTRKGSQTACVCPGTSLTPVSDGKAQLFRIGETFSPFLQRCRVRVRTSKLRNIYARPLYTAGTGSRRRPRHSRRPHLGG